VRKKIPFKCADLGFPEEWCREFTPSYDLLEEVTQALGRRPTHAELRRAYLLHAARCRRLAELANEGDERAIEMYAEMGCKREGHIQIGGGRLRSRFPDAGMYPRDASRGGPSSFRGVQREGPVTVGEPISDVTQARLTDRTAPFSDRTQSLDTFKVTRARKRKKKERRDLEGEIRSGIEVYMGTTGQDLGLQVPLTPRPLVEAGVPPQAARVLVKRARGRVIMPPLFLALEGEESEREHSKFLPSAPKRTRIDYKRLSNVNLYELPSVLARIIDKSRREGRLLSPESAVSNPRFPMAYDYDYDDLFGALALENGYWKPDGPHRKKRGQFGARRQQPTNRTNPPRDPVTGQFVSRDNGVSTFGRTTAKHKKGTARYRKAHGLGGPGTKKARRAKASRKNPAKNFAQKGRLVAYDESPWGHDMPPGYPYAVGKGPYGTYRAVPPANRRNPLALENGWDREPSAAEIAKHGYVKAKIRANKDTAPASSRKPRKGKKGGRKTQRAKEVADYSTEVKFTKQGQPYIILASGQPKFISRDAAARQGYAASNPKRDRKGRFVSSKRKSSSKRRKSSRRRR
jgi:hypothetical protein